MIDPREVDERLTELERNVEMDAAVRRLEQSSIGPGNFRVHDGGSLKIEDGGDLVIVDGDLILGEGIIDGNVLETQFDAIFRSSKRTVDASTSWSNGAEVTISPPSWATRTLISISSSVDTRTRAEIRLGINGSYTIQIDCNEFAAGFDNRYTGAISWYQTVNGSGSFPVSLQLREVGLGWPTNTSGNICALEVSAIFYR